MQVTLPEEVKMELAIDAIAQRYSTTPEKVEQMTLGRFHTAITIISAEHDFKTRQSKQIQAKAKMRK